MRLDARKGDIDWDIYDAKTCSTPTMVVWVDDVLAQWGQYVKDRAWITLHGTPRLDCHQEERINIYPERRLVVFNEVADNSDTELIKAAPISESEAACANV